MWPSSVKRGRTVSFDTVLDPETTDPPSPPRRRATDGGGRPRWARLGSQRAIAGGHESQRSLTARRIARAASWRSWRKPGGDPAARLAPRDDAEGDGEAMLVLLQQSIEDETLFVFGSVGLLVAWSTACAGFATWLGADAARDPEGRSDRWMEAIDSSKGAINILGTMFAFTLVFRFNTCYERWWYGRLSWGKTSHLLSTRATCSCSASHLTCLCMMHAQATSSPNASI